MAFSSPINKKDIVAFDFQENNGFNIAGYVNNWPVLKLTFQDIETVKLEDVIEMVGNDNTVSNDSELKKLFVKLLIYLVLELPALEIKSITNSRNKKFREKRKELFTLYESKEHGYTLKRLPPIASYCSITETSSGFKVIPNGYYRRTISVPSALYPMPNSRTTPRLFTPENTEDFTNDSISDALSNIEFFPGRCYTNANKIISILGEDFKFYSGWVFIYGKDVHNAWVVKEKSIIDVANTRKDNSINPESNFSKQEYAKFLLNTIKKICNLKRNTHSGK